MRRRDFLTGSLGAMPLLAAVQGAAGGETAGQRPDASGSRPNILFIVADQHNAKCMGHLGHPNVQTPHLDRLAAQGARFSHCTTANPICTPSRVSFLSGQYCHNHGYYGLSGQHPGGLPSVLSHFRAAGYTTGALGKIHCPENWVEGHCDAFHDSAGKSVAGRSPEYTAYLRERGLLDLEDHAAMQEFGSKGRQTCDARPSRVSYRDGQEGWVVTKSLEFMDAASRAQRPFLLHVSLPKPHQCYTPAQEYWDLYRESELVLPPSCDYDMKGKAPHLKETAGRWMKGDWTLFEPRTFEAGRLRKLHGYLGNISHVDHAVGELMAALESRGLEHNTVVVYISDHGDYACEHNLMEKAPGICSDAITRVPMIWRWPEQIVAGHVVDTIAETIDVPNTLCVLAGLPAMETSDGQDLSAALRGGPGEAGRAGLTENPWSKSLRSGDWRLVTYPKEMFAQEYPGGFGELYNLDADPWEMKNLYFDPGHAEQVRALRDALFDRLVTTTRPSTIQGSTVTAGENPQRVLHYGHDPNADNKMHPDRVRKASGTIFVNYL